MSEPAAITARTALDMIEARMPPFDFASAKDCASALRKLPSLDGGRIRDLSEFRLSRASVEHVFARLERMPPASAKERRARANMRTRLNTLVRLAEGVPAVSEPWRALEAALGRIRDEDGLADQSFVSVTGTLKNAALEDGLDPADLTADWLARRAREAIRKRRESLFKGARILDAQRSRLPAGLRPLAPFGELGPEAGGARRSAPLPPRLARELAAYLAGRVGGTTTEGLRPDRRVQVSSGIKDVVSTTIYDQALKWFLDSLRVGGGLDLAPQDPGLAEIARMDWLAKVVFQALDDVEADREDRPTVLPWRPIAPQTVHGRAWALVRMFTDVEPGFQLQAAPKEMADGRTGAMTSAQLLGFVYDRIDDKGMTEAHRRFCLDLLADENRQRLLLNMHTHCWREAQELWARRESLAPDALRDAVDRCVLAAMLAVVVHIPFRARTLTELTLEGAAPDVILPRRRPVIDFAVFRKRMKVPKDFDALLEDDALSKPRRILDWFVSGPREALLRDPRLLRAADRRPERLFCGVDEARYGRILTQWSEDAGMRMTTHMFRHAIATLLVNVCGTGLEDAALMLGNTAGTVERRYALIDGVRRRGVALGRLADRRRTLADVKHPGRAGR